MEKEYEKVYIYIYIYILYMCIYMTYDTISLAVEQKLTQHYK